MSSHRAQAPWWPSPFLISFAVYQGFACLIPLQSPPESCGHSSSQIQPQSLHRWIASENGLHISVLLLLPCLQLPKCAKKHPKKKKKKEPFPISDSTMIHEFVSASYSGLRCFYWSSIHSLFPSLYISNSKRSGPRLFHTYWFSFCNWIVEIKVWPLGKEIAYCLHANHKSCLHAQHRSTSMNLLNPCNLPSPSRFR